MRRHAKQRSCGGLLSNAKLSSIPSVMRRGRRQKKSRRCKRSSQQKTLAPLLLLQSYASSKHKSSTSKRVGTRSSSREKSAELLFSTSVFLHWSLRSH